MTLAQDVLVDPAQAEWERASRDPLEVLTTGERIEAQKLISDGDQAHTVAAAALVLGGAFLLYRAFMARKLARLANPTVTRVIIQTASDYYWRQFFPTWILVTGPALRGAAGAALDLRTGEVPDELLFALADDYAERLGRYLHESSQQALMENFSANLNKRLPRQAAAKRALDGIGLSQRQTRALQATKAALPVSSVLARNPDVQQQAFIERSLVDRARQIGENEAFSVSQEGRQLGWMYRQSKGLLPADTKRMWITARDERVCKTCGPMHRKTVALNKPFETPRGAMWSPGAHPNCRCEIVLKVPVTRDAFIRKDLFGPALAEFNEEHPRHNSGRFAVKTKEVEAPTLPKVDTPQVARVQIPQIPQANLPKVAPQVTTAPPQVQTAGPQAQAPQAVTAQALLSAVQAIPAQASQVQAVVTAQAQTAPAKPKVQTPTKAPARPKTKVTYKHKIAAVYAVDDGLAGDATAKEFTDQKFVGYDEMLKDANRQINDRIAERTEELMERGIHKQPVVFPNGDVHDEELTKDEVYAFVEAEVFGLPDSPGREIARKWGVERKQFVMDVYEVSEVDTSKTAGDAHAYRDNDSWEINGTYTTQFYGKGELHPYGVPIRIVHLKLEGAPDDEELD